MNKPNSAQYWIKRTGDIFNKLDATDAVITKLLYDYYKKAGKEVNDQLEAFYKRYADVNGITKEQAQQQVNMLDLSDYVKEANDYRRSNNKDPEVLKRLNQYYQSAQISALELLKAQMSFAILKATKAYHDSFEEYLSETAKFVSERIAEGYAHNTLNEGALKQILQARWFGGNYSSRIWKNGDEFAKKLQETMLRSFTYGINPRVTAKDLRKFVREAYRELKKMKYVTERLARTESTFVANLAIKDRYEKDDIKRYEFLAVIDKRTSQICKSLNGKEFNIKDYSAGVNAPPMHAHCRSTIAPANSELHKYDRYS